MAEACVQCGKEFNSFNDVVQSTKDPTRCTVCAKNPGEPGQTAPAQTARKVVGYPAESSGFSIVGLALLGIGLILIVVGYSAGSHRFSPDPNAPLYMMAGIGLFPAGVLLLCLGKILGELRGLRNAANHLVRKSEEEGNA